MPWWGWALTVWLPASITTGFIVGRRLRTIGGRYPIVDPAPPRPPSVDSGPTPTPVEWDWHTIVPRDNRE